MGNVAETRRRGSASPPPGRAPTPPRSRPSVTVRRRRALLAVTIVVLCLVGLLFAFVYPTRSLLQERAQISAAQAHISQLQRATQALDRQSAQLRSPVEVERLAREHYGLVLPGETPYVLVPAAPATPTPAPTPPTTAPARH